MKRYADAREEFQAAIDLLESKGGAFFRAYVSEAYLGWAEATIKDRKADREAVARIDRKSTRLNSSHDQMSYAVFCLKKKKLVKNLFSPYQASLLVRYGLQYCAYYLLSGDMLLAPPYKATSGLEIPTPLAVAVLHFFHRPTSSNALTEINLVLEQAISVAISRGLFIPEGTTSGKIPVAANSLGRQSQLMLDDIIPQRVEDTNLLKSSNPLASSIVIADKKARRLFAAIDGRKNVGELCASL